MRETTSVLFLYIGFALAGMLAVSALAYLWWMAKWVMGYAARTLEWVLGNHTLGSWRVSGRR